ncbi:hemoglobin subunit alpha-5-like [Hyperolius riggenbachi]|uniref:hemoglobin subunit alpha-5-like n=1 Tax=Hyperolius riggenbachi TaxID=752182 RepID=UPI0035A38D34
MLNGHTVVHELQFSFGCIFYLLTGHGRSCCPSLYKSGECRAEQYNYPASLSVTTGNNTEAKMTFSDAEKAAIQAILSKASGHEDALGGEALERLFMCYPQTKTYFSKMNLEHGSPAVKALGGKVLKAIGLANQHIDNPSKALSALRDLHAHNRVDPQNFALLNECILVVLAVHFPEDFTPCAHAAWDKFLASISACLTKC